MIKSYVTEKGNWYDKATVYYIPKKIGKINTKLIGFLRNRKLLPIGHRFRQPQEEY